MAELSSEEASPGIRRQTSATMGKNWKAQVKKDKTIYKELSECVKQRRKKYADLNDLLEKRELVCSLSARTAKKEPVVETDSVGVKPEYVRKAFIKHEEVEQAIEVALETGSRVYGSQEGVSRKEVLEFVKKKFGKQIEAAEEQSSEEPKLQLMCKVIKATDLKVKSGNGTAHRNPYCRVGILNQKHYRPGSDFKFMAEWHKVGEVGDVVSTSYKTATLEPSWNEDLQLSVNSIEEDVIVVEVWNHPPLEDGSKKKRNKGLMPHRKEDFIGWMFHPLLLVPIAGAELKFTLMSRGKKPLNGFITLFLSIQGDTEEKALQVRLEEHHILTRALIDDFSKEDGERKLEWNGELCTESEKLLEYHGALNGLNKLQMASVRLSELFRYHKHETVELKAFIEVIKRMKELQLLFPGQETDNASLGSMSSSTPPDSPELLDTSWVNQLFSDLQLLEADLMDTMNDHIRLINFGFGGKPDSIYPHLSLLLELYTFKAFTDQMNPRRELSRQLEKCIEPSVNSWFSMLKATVMPKRGFEPKELRDLCVHCVKWSEKVVEKLILHETFTRADVDYFSFYLWSLDEQLSEEVKKGLEMYRKQNPDTITFEIYTYFQRLVEISENADDDIRSKLTIPGFHKWFQEFVPGWIDVATEKCESRIKQAIELDEIVKITEDLKLSSSAVDTNGFLLQTATFWKHLDWPVASEAYGYAVSLIQNMCNCVNIFIEKVFNGLTPKDLHDEQGRFKASEKLCLVLNNMFHVREQISEMPQHMELEMLYKMLHEEDEKKYALAEDGGLGVGDMDFDPMMPLKIKAKNVLSELLISADEDIMNKINELIGKICQNILPDIKQLINEIVNTNANDDDVQMVVAPLFDYLTENLITLGNNLLPQVFQSVIATLWEVSVEAIAKVVDDSHKRNLPVYSRLYDTLKSLREFYYCDGAGVSIRALDSEAYSSLKSKLDILGMPTDELIVRFYLDFMKHQQEKIKEKKFGELQFSVGYIKESSVIEVNIIQGDDMEMIAEPYIKLRLSSVCQASDKHWKTKPVKGMQKAPFFNEDIKLSVTGEEMNSDGSLVLFYLLDRKLRSKGPYGMCALACKKIPQLSASSKSSIMEPIGPERKNFRLPLFRFTVETPSLTELIARADKKDAKASSFLKINELLLSHFSHVNLHPQKHKFGTLR